MGNTQWVYKLTFVYLKAIFFNKREQVTEAWKTDLDGGDEGGRLTTELYACMHSPLTALLEILTTLL